MEIQGIIKTEMTCDDLIKIITRFLLILEEEWNGLHIHY